MISLVVEHDGRSEFPIRLKILVEKTDRNCEPKTSTSVCKEMAVDPLESSPASCYTVESGAGAVLGKRDRGPILGKAQQSDSAFWS